MFIYIVDKDTYVLKTINETYIYKGIKLDLDKNYIYLDKQYYFDDDSKVKKIELKKYRIISENKYYFIELYIYENDKGFIDYKLYKKENFIISASDKATIKVKNSLINDLYFEYKDNYISCNYPVFINDNLYHNEIINDNDKVVVNGIVIYFYKDFLYINSFLISPRIKEYIPEYRKIEYRNKVESKQIKLKEDIDELIVPEIKKLNLKEDKKQNTNILNNSVMFLSSLMMSSLGFYNSYLNNQPLHQRIAFLIMPLSLGLTGIIIPIIRNEVDHYKINKLNKQKIIDYIAYLDEYIEQLKDSISKYIQNINCDYFTIDNTNELFSYSKNDRYFLNISIGKITINKDIEINDVDIKDIDDRYKKIHLMLKDIENYPLLLDLKKYRVVDIICKDEERKYYLYKLILEIVFKHSYTDILICLYSNNESIIDDLYNLPHLFINHQRMTFNKKEELIEFDQTNNERKAIVFLFDNIDYSFSNSNITVIRFNSLLSDIKKIEGPIIEYRNNKGYLYDGKIKEFYFEKQLFDYKKYYDYFGKLNNFTQIKTSYNFNDVYDADEIGLYYDNNYPGLKAIFAYTDNDYFSIDLDESKQGPHGLIGGSTGSGKSELIVSLLLSLCIRYSCEYLNIVLIDYKGGGLAQSLSYDGRMVPHIVASITNLENNVLERLIISLKNECLFRQKLFNKLSRKINKSITNIVEYQKERSDEIKLANLLIVVDEFAQLKMEEPQYIKELIGISRVGRSLGIHLILATQKPAGVIDDEIWSNSKFKIALKVNEEKDSTDIIKTKDSAYLHNPGEFYLRVNDSLSKATSFYSKKDINDMDDIRVSLLDNCLNEISDVKKVNNNRLPLSKTYCKAIIEASNKRNHIARPIKFNLPNSSYRRKLCLNRCLVFGEIDDYLNGETKLLAFYIYSSLLIYSSRKNEINNIINNLYDFDIKTVVISNKQYDCVDCVLYDETEDIDYVFDKMLSEDITVVIEDISILLSYDDTYVTSISKLIRKLNNTKSSIIALTSNSNINFRIVNAFNERLIIGSSDIANQTNLFNKRSELKGRSFYYKEDVMPFVETIIEKIYEGQKKYEIVKRIPEIIKAQIKDDKYLIGYDTNTREKIYASKDIVIISNNKEIIDRYKNSYKDLSCYIYSRDLLKQNFNKFVWLSNGIFMQDLFITDLRKDLLSNEGIYYENGKTIKIRIIDE